MTEEQVEKFFDSEYYDELEGIAMNKAKDYFDAICVEQDIDTASRRTVVQVTLEPQYDENGEKEGYKTDVFLAGFSGDTVALAIGRLATSFLKSVKADEDMITEYVGHIAIRLAEAIERDIEHDKKEEEENDLLQSIKNLLQKLEREAK